MAEVLVPEIFVPDNYRRLYAFPSEVTDEELLEHFRSRGIREGLVGSPGALRRHQIEAAGAEDSVLEIGPLNAPAMQGAHVKYMDAFDTEGLRKYARSAGLDPQTVPDIDYVSPSGSFEMVDRKFKAVFSSHNIEHIPDIVRHINNISEILNEGGRYYIICPDKRYCFDHFRAESSIADVVNSYLLKPERHLTRTHLSHRLMYTPNNDPSRHWAGDHGTPVYRGGGAVLQTIIKGLPTGDSYVDAHAWQFTPTSFFTIMKALYEAGLITMWPERVFHTPRNLFEFTAVLRKGGTPDYAAAFVEPGHGVAEPDPHIRVQELEEQGRELRAAVAREAAARQAAEERYMKFRKSASWWLTKPIRSIEKRIRTLF